MSIFSARFTTGQVISAAGVTNASLQTWIRRGAIVSSKGEEIASPGSPGYRRSFSFRNVLAIAITKELIDIGVELGDASNAAAMFAYSGKISRLPGLPFTMQVGTLLCVAGEKSRVIAWEPGKDPIAGILHAFHPSPGFVVLYVNPIFDRVTKALGYCPDEVLDLVRK